MPSSLKLNDAGQTSGSGPLVATSCTLDQRPLQEVSLCFGAGRHDISYDALSTRERGAQIAKNARHGAPQQVTLPLR